MNEYGSLCTEWYDALYKYPPPEELKLYRSYLKSTESTALEPMCGAGRFLIPMSAQSNTIYGFDHSVPMLNLCRAKLLQQGLHAHLSHALLRDFSYPIQFDLIFITSGSFGLIIDQDEALVCLQRIYAHLADDGFFLVEIETPLEDRESLKTMHTMEVPINTRESLLLQKSESYDPVQDIYTSDLLFEKRKSGTICESETMVFVIKHYEPEAFESLLHAAGFRGVRIVRREQTQLESKLTTKSLIYECCK